ncbi:glutathione peroxidase [Rhodoferax sp. 4810]|uniref:Glutathione peroxidase n=1 Tax=Thiospirillum jenense TaxID=1653858 RepID=A0A839HBU6_9GAMM|nr:glutathione peroxidase [Thiospirillum jenense]MBB1072960.1 glutathione peroxidase [Rhodoferax jenense]MBB1124906.1 glutathione peroxidase [Thiospirillum jenense]
MFPDRTGQPVPHVVFRTRTDHDWLDVTTDELFKNKTVIVFSLPGAFTPTCSSTHVPRFNHLAATFKQHGVDDIICMAVNDTFVMNAWQEAERAHNLRFIPDGNGEFTEAMGLLVDKDDIGFGKRSWRYSMLVRNGIIEKQFIEPEEPGDPFKVSDADTMLAYLAPAANKPLDITVFTRPGCPYCAKAKDLLKKSGMDFEELVLNRDYTELSLRAVAGATTVPQIFIGGQKIGGSDDLETWFSKR